MAMDFEEELKQYVGATPVQGNISLKIEANGYGVVVHELGDLALKGRAGHDEILTFLYRDQFDPDEPDAERPVRRAQIVVKDLGIVEQGEQS